MKNFLILILILILIYFSLDFFGNTSIYIDPNCADITKKDLVNQFDNESFLREAMNRAGLDTNYIINDATAPLIASHLVKLGGTISGNCAFQ